LKQILLFGAGKSAGALIEQLLKDAFENGWKLVVVDSNAVLIQEKLQNHSSGNAVVMDILDADLRFNLIDQSDLVISLLPPHLHLLVAKDCLKASKNLLTASYIDDEMRCLEQEINEKGLLFLCEMGLDPGIDHMSIMDILEKINQKGGVVSSLISHCGGLVAPESDDNPWHYKISWNPRNVIQAGKAGAIYKKEGKIIEENYEMIFNPDRLVDVTYRDIQLGYYPNRNSIPYLSLYHLEHVDTFIRTTLRFPDFISGWKNLIELKLTDDNMVYETDGLSIQAFFAKHFSEVNFNEWLDNQLQQQMNLSQQTLQDLESATTNDDRLIKSAKLADQMEATNTLLKQLFFLGIEDDQKLINMGKRTVAEILQFILEEKWKLAETDKDMVVMLHEIEYKQDNKNYKLKSEFVIIGDDSRKTAMAKTVGLPLAIAAKMILMGQLNEIGLMIPTKKSIYEPVLLELEKYGIAFKESIVAS
jgi:saccharopine dehydrogenase-like NADP-dependent oxidoreductase